jgi:uncharacterized protein
MAAEKLPAYMGRPIAAHHIMAKPFGPVCNLDCTYCYYLSKKNLLQPENKWCMSDELAELFIRQNIESHNFPEVVFSWQGGEPSMLGLDFFKKVVEIEKKYALQHMKIENDLQTNGTLLDEEWMEFLKENNWLVGLSIDGPAHLHDMHRVRKDESGTHARVMRTLKLLHIYGVPFNTLTVVNNDNARHPLAVYRFLRDEAGSKRIQFIPIAEPVGFEHLSPAHWEANDMPVMGSAKTRPGREGAVVTDWSVGPEDYGNFMCRVFDEWYAHDIGRTWVYNFEALVYSALGKDSPMCVFRPECGFTLAIEHNGDVFSCDHFVYPQYRLGNIRETHISLLVNSLPQVEFGRNKFKNLTKHCLDCRYLSICNGECPKNRFISSPEGEPGHNYLCSGLKKFFAHTEKRVGLLADEIRESGMEF